MLRKRNEHSIEKRIRTHYILHHIQCIAICNIDMHPHRWIFAHNDVSSAGLAGIIVRVHGVSIMWSFAHDFRRMPVMVCDRYPFLLPASGSCPTFCVDLDKAESRVLEPIRKHQEKKMICTKRKLHCSLLFSQSLFVFVLGIVRLSHIDFLKSYKEQIHYFSYFKPLSLWLQLSF